MREAKCKYFGTCGGCSAQHIKYDVQLENKKKVLVDAIGFDDVEVHSGKEYGYRNRMDMIFHAKGLGFRKRGKWDSIVDIEECPISNNQLNELMSEVRAFFKDVDYFDIKKQTGTFKYAVIRTPQEDSSISFVLNADSSRIKDATDLIEEFSKATTANNVLVTYVPQKTDMSISGDFYVVKGEEMLNESFLDRNFIYSVQGFFQNNHEMAEKMQDYVNNLLKTYDTKDAHLLDLYGGVGTFGIINSSLFKSTKIVESVQPCIDAANKNIESNDVENAEALVLDAKQLKKLELESPLYIITDPPRSGMHKNTISQLNKLKPEVIIYVSCNVKQLGKEIHKFLDYEIKSAALFDLFPQTPHSEAVIELVRTTS